MRHDERQRSHMRTAEKNEGKTVWEEKKEWKKKDKDYKNREGKRVRTKKK